jgi:hypothetical protein
LTRRKALCVNSVGGNGFGACVGGDGIEGLDLALEGSGRRMRSDGVIRRIWGELAFGSAIGRVGQRLDRVVRSIGPLIRRIGASKRSETVIRSIGREVRRICAAGGDETLRRGRRVGRV